MFTFLINRIHFSRIIKTNWDVKTRQRSQQVCKNKAKTLKGFKKSVRPTRHLKNDIRFRKLLRTCCYLDGLYGGELVFIRRRRWRWTLFVAIMVDTHSLLAPVMPNHFSSTAAMVVDFSYLNLAYQRYKSSDFTRASLAPSYLLPIRKIVRTARSSQPSI